MVTPFDIRTPADDRAASESISRYLRSSFARDVSNPNVEWTPPADGSSRSATVAISAGGGGTPTGAPDTGSADDDRFATRSLNNLTGPTAINTALVWNPQALDAGVPTGSAGIGVSTAGDVFIKARTLGDEFHFQTANAAGDGEINHLTIKDQSLEIGRPDSQEQPHTNGVITRTGGTLEIMVNGHIIDLGELSFLSGASAWPNPFSRLRILKTEDNLPHNLHEDALEQRLGNIRGAIGIVVAGEPTRSIGGLHHVYLTVRGSRYWAMIICNGIVAAPAGGVATPALPYVGGPRRRVYLASGAGAAPTRALIAAQTQFSGRPVAYEDTTTSDVTNRANTLQNITLGITSTINNRAANMLQFAVRTVGHGPVSGFARADAEVLVWRPNRVSSSALSRLTHTFLDGLFPAGQYSQTHPQPLGDGSSVLATNSGVRRLYVKIAGRWFYWTLTLQTYA